MYKKIPIQTGSDLLGPYIVVIGKRIMETIMPITAKTILLSDFIMFSHACNKEPKDLSN